MLRSISLASAIIASSAIIANSSYITPDIGWLYQERTDVITGDISRIAVLPTKNLDRAVSSIKDSQLLIAVRCVSNMPAVSFSSSVIFMRAGSSEVGYKFDGREGRVFEPDHVDGKVASAIDPVKALAFLADARNSEAGVVRLRGATGTAVFRFTATGAKAALDKALDGCGWYKATP